MGNSEQGILIRYRIQFKDNVCNLQRRYDVVLSTISLSSNRFCLILAKALFLQMARRADE
jgi:hypothetical protein